MRIRIARDMNEIDRLRPTWEFLYANDPQATLFQTFAWNRLAASHFGNRESPYVVLAESDSGMALIPAAVTAQRMTLLGETLFDYRGALSVGDPHALHSAQARLAEQRLPFSITYLRGESVRQHWKIFQPQAFVPAPQILAREMNSEAFAAGHARARRALRQLGREGVEFHHYDGYEQDLVGWIYGKKAEQLVHNSNNLFSDPMRVGYVKLASRLYPKSCDIYTLEIAGRPISALLTFRDRNVRRFYTIWFDHEWATFSPGIALLYEVTRLALAAELDCDYMTGEQSHKMRFATSSVPLFHVDISAEDLAGTELFAIPSAA